MGPKTGYAKLVIALLLAASIAYTAPILTISEGGVYSGIMSVNSAQDFDSPNVYVATTKPVRITRSYFSSCGYHIVECPDANVTIDNCVFVYCGPQAIPGGTSTRSVYISDITKSFLSSVTHCRFTGPIGCAIGIERGDGGNCQIAIACNRFEDCFDSVQLANVRSAENVAIYWNQCSASGRYYQNDQFSVYQSSGTPDHPISIRWNLIQGTPDGGFVPGSEGIQAGDSGSSYVLVEYNTLLNAGLCIFYANGNTSALVNNTVVGIGPAQSWSSGLAVQPDAGSAVGNIVAWWNTQQGSTQDFANRFNEPGNTSWGKDMITLSEEQSLYAQWINKAVQSGQYIGPYYERNNGITYPQAGDFGK
jgi:hypothetical protein